ncbi:hypothetical protein FB004_11269 [Sinorhizobium medicae]|nr:hypothetical protein [Sinorhizobium medicae]MBO1965072.1 hypothetical protein [Sinorhizobium medicae]TWA19704.1 hypothetical protein FB004_11269 [Sinorhizobium medicae]TWA21638.1 hypothetical protein FB006_111170 [Sinorhizobium medicae]TWA32142.1 hypothetical protein FB007_111129 [Sinorhizobium medicae]
MKKPAARVKRAAGFSVFSDEESVNAAALSRHRQLAALATRLPAPCVAFTAFAVSCPAPRIVFAQELRVASAIRTAPIVAMDFVVMTMIPLC